MKEEVLQIEINSKDNIYEIRPFQNIINYFFNVSISVHH